MFCLFYYLFVVIIRLLGTRIAELEHRLKVLEISGLWSTPDNDEDDEIIKEKEPNISWEVDEEEEEEEPVIEDNDGALVLQGIFNNYL